MARVSYVKSARASTKPRRCMRCNHEVQVGESYKHVSLKTGPYSSITRVWCKDHNPLMSELTTNDRKSRLLAAQEALEDALENFRNGTISMDDLQAEFELQAGEAEDISNEYQDSADNMPESLQSSQQVEDMREAASNVQEWSEALRDVDWPDFDPEECLECQGFEDDPQHDESDDGDYDHDFQPTEPSDVDISSAEDAVMSLQI